MTAYGNRSAALQPAISNEDLLAFLEEDESPFARTLFVGNVDSKVTRKLLYELMIQVGPIESIKIVPLREGATKTFAFIVFEDAASVRYAMLAFKGVALFRSALSLNYSGAHKNKPRTVFPPYPPTFFQLPAGYDSLSEDVKRTLYQAQVLPPPEYKSGYFLQPPSASKFFDYCEESEPYAYQTQRDEDGIPRSKQMRGDPGHGFSMFERDGLMRNGPHGEPVPNRNGQIAYPPPPPPSHPYGQYPPAQANDFFQPPAQYYHPQNHSEPGPSGGYSGYSQQIPQQQVYPSQTPPWASHPQHGQRNLSPGQTDPYYQYHSQPQGHPYYSPQGY